MERRTPNGGNVFWKSGRELIDGHTHVRYWRASGQRSPGLSFSYAHPTFLQARSLSASFGLLNVFLQVVPATLSDGYTPPCRSVEASSDQQPLPRRTPTVCCVHDTRLEHKVRQRPASDRRVGPERAACGPRKLPPGAAVVRQS